MNRPCLFFLHRSPFHSTLPWLAYRLARDLAKQHRVHAAFFYADAVWIADKTTNIQSHGMQLTAAWSRLALEYRFPCRLCRSSAVRRNIISDHAEDTHKLAPGFQSGSLTEFIAWQKQHTQILVF